MSSTLFWVYLFQTQIYNIFVYINLSSSFNIHCTVDSSPKCWHIFLTFSTHCTVNYTICLPIFIVSCIYAINPFDPILDLLSQEYSTWLLSILHRQSRGEAGEVVQKCDDILPGCLAGRTLARLLQLTFLFHAEYAYIVDTFVCIGTSNCDYALSLNLQTCIWHGL